VLQYPLRPLDVSCLRRLITRSEHDDKHTASAREEESIARANIDSHLGDFATNRVPIAGITSLCQTQARGDPDLSPPVLQKSQSWNSRVWRITCIGQLYPIGYDRQDPGLTLTCSSAGWFALPRWVAIRGVGSWPRIAVGRPVAGHPPHGSERAQCGHSDLRPDPVWIRLPLCVIDLHTPLAYRERTAHTATGQTLNRETFERLLETARTLRRKRRERLAGLLAGHRKPRGSEGTDDIDVRAVRRLTGLSQAKFAELLGIELSTLRNWEQGRRAPTGPARALLRAIRNSPVDVIKALTA